MPTPPAPAASHAVDRELEDTFPASDPPSMSTPSTATTRSEDPASRDDAIAWIDLYRIEEASPAGAIPNPDVAAIGKDAGGTQNFATSAALALLHHLVNPASHDARVCLLRTRVPLERIDSVAIASRATRPGLSDDAAAPAPAVFPGCFRQSTLSPAEREVLWDTEHPDAGEMRVVSRTVFQLDERLVALQAR